MANEIEKAQEQRPSLIATMAAKYNLSATQFMNTIKKTCMPANATDEEFCAYLMVAQQYNLNPIMREIYAFPKKGGGIQPIVGIDGWINMVNQHTNFDGLEFVVNKTDKGLIESITCRMWRKDRTRSTECTEFLTECRRNTDPWNQMPSRMLRHRAFIQCARLAFGFTGIMDDDEGETIKVVEGQVVEPAPQMQPERKGTAAVKEALKAAPAFQAAEQKSAPAIPQPEAAAPMVAPPGQPTAEAAPAAKKTRKGYTRQVGDAGFKPVEGAPATPPPPTVADQAARAGVPTPSAPAQTKTAGGAVTITSGLPPKDYKPPSDTLDTTTFIPAAARKVAIQEGFLYRITDDHATVYRTLVEGWAIMARDAMPNKDAGFAGKKITVTYFPYGGEYYIYDLVVEEPAPVAPQGNQDEEPLEGPGEEQPIEQAM